MKLAVAVLVAGALRLAASSSLAPVDSAQESYRLADDALLQLTPAPALFLTAPDGQVEAVDALTGRVRWRTPKMSFVLAARGDRLLALRPPGPPDKRGCAPVIVNARSGRIVRDVPTDGVAWPGCPGNSINGSSQFAPFVRDGVDYLGWLVTWHPTPGGAYRGPDYRYPPGSSGSRLGVVAIDWLRGGLAPAASTMADSVSPLHPFNANTTTVLVDGRSMAVDRVLDQGRVARLVLRRWSASGRLPDVVLGEPPWNSCGVEFTLDHRHVLAVWQVPERHDPFLYHVRVFDVSTGQLVGEADATSWPIGGALIGSTLVTYFPMRVFAIDLKTGAERWSRPVKDLAYHGPYPPAANRAAPAEPRPTRP